MRVGMLADKWDSLMAARRVFELAGMRARWLVVILVVASVRQKALQSVALMGPLWGKLKAPEKAALMGALLEIQLAGRSVSVTEQLKVGGSAAQLACCWVVCWAHHWVGESASWLDWRMAACWAERWVSEMGLMLVFLLDKM